MGNDIRKNYLNQQYGTKESEESIWALELLAQISVLQAMANNAGKKGVGIKTLLNKLERQLKTNKPIKQILKSVQNKLKKYKQELEKTR